MKRLISTTLAASLALVSLGSAGAMAQPYPGYNHGPGYGPPPIVRHDDGYGWHRGGYFHGPRYVIRDHDYGRYHLRPPPRGYEWVRSGSQFVLIAVASGVIADILLNR